MSLRLDEEFGAENFVGKSRGRRPTRPARPQRVSASHDTILVYRKTSEWRPNKVARLASTDDAFGNQDGDPTLSARRRSHRAWRAGARPCLRNSAPDLQGHGLPRRGPPLGVSPGVAAGEDVGVRRVRLREIDDAVNRAQVSGVPINEARARREGPHAYPSLSKLRLRVQGRSTTPAPGLSFYLTGPGGSRGIQRKQYISDEGRVPETWWPHAEVGHNRSAKNEIKALFPEAHPFSTPKPERLLQPDHPTSPLTPATSS